jgi:hypothetical protein
MQVGESARIAQNNAVRVSEIVRKALLAQAATAMTENVLEFKVQIRLE